MMRSVSLLPAFLMLSLLAATACVQGQENSRPTGSTPVTGTTTPNAGTPVTTASSATHASAQPAPTKGNSPAEPAGNLTPEREAAALKFVELHHPELLHLLTALKRGKRPQYRVALQEIFRVSERLARINDRQPERYEQELELWKINSRLTLLIASLAMAEDEPETIAQIRNLIERRYQLETEMLTAEAQALQQRLDRLEKNLSRRQELQREAIERQLERITRPYTDSPPASGNPAAGSRGEVKSNPPVGRDPSKSKP